MSRNSPCVRIVLQSNLEGQIMNNDKIVRRNLQILSTNFDLCFKVWNFVICHVNKSMFCNVIPSYVSYIVIIDQYFSVK